MYPGVGNHNGSVVRHTVGDILLFQQGDNRAAILFAQVGKEYFPVRLLAPQYCSDKHRDNRCQGYRETDFLLGAEPIERITQTLQGVP